MFVRKVFRRWRFLVAGALASAVLLGVPAPASAAVTCDLSSGVLTVTFGAAGDIGELAVESGEITLNPGNPVTCAGPQAPPTVTNTAAISITDGGNPQPTQVLVVSGARNFAPGAGTEDNGVPEIEMFVNLDGTDSGLLVTLGGVQGVMDWGTTGVNTNRIDESGSRDADIFIQDVQELVALGSSGNDEISAQGGSGTGSPLTRDITISGLDGTDLLQAGAGSDRVLAFEGNDILFGGGGDDILVPDEGSDSVGGGADSDTVVLNPSGPVTVDLALGGPQDTGEGMDAISAVENATAGARAPATLRGDDGPNVLTTFDFADTLEGRGGADVLNAGGGADSLLVRDGGADTADCGPDADSVRPDDGGIDTLIACESVLFPTPVGGGGAQGGGGAGGAGGLLPAAFGTRTLVTLAPAARRIPARGRLSVRVINGNAFEVTGTLAGARLRQLSSAQRRRGARLPAKAFRVPANARTTVRLRLPRALRRHLARRGRLRLRMVAQVSDPAGNTRTVRRTLSPRLKPPRRR